MEDTDETLLSVADGARLRKIATYLSSEHYSELPRDLRLIASRIEKAVQEVPRPPNPGHTPGERSGV